MPTKNKGRSKLFHRQKLCFKKYNNVKYTNKYKVNNVIE